MVSKLPLSFTQEAAEREGREEAEEPVSPSLSDADGRTGAFPDNP